MKSVFVFFLMLSLLFSLPLLAQEKDLKLNTESTSVIPAKMSYQGVLTDNNGVPQNGTFTMTFGLYTTPTGGSALWSETQNTVQVTNGIFNALLGSVTPINLSFDVTYYLNVSVQGTKLLPRIELASSGYSFNTARIQGIPVSSTTPSTGQVLKYSGGQWSPGTAFDEMDPPGERVTLYKKEFSVIDPTGVLLNLVATNGGVGIRFYKDFSFGNETETNPWHMGWIEGVPNYQGLAILRDWAFTAALWEEDGKLIVGKLHPHPPANAAADARFEVRGTVDEVQAMVKASESQTSDIFQVVDGEGRKSLTVKSEGNIVVGSPDDPKGIILYDTVDGSAYYLKVTNGRLELSPVE